MTLLLLCVIVFVVVCLAGFTVWIGSVLEAGSHADELSERDAELLTRPLGNVSVVDKRGRG